MTRKASTAGNDADLDVHAGGQVEPFVQRFDRFLRRPQNVDQPLVRPDFELLAALPVDVRRPQHGVPLDARRQRDRPVHLGVAFLRRLHDLRSRPVEDLVVVPFHPDADAFAGIRHADSPRLPRRHSHRERTNVEAAFGSVKGEARRKGECWVAPAASRCHQDTWTNGVPLPIISTHPSRQEPLMFRLLPALAVALLAAVPLHAADAITWKKTVLDRKFRSEGVAVADVNKDGKIDVLNGEYWYEAPDWTPHEMKPFTDYKDGLRNYSHSFACWADDFNGDGYPDLIVIDFPGDPCFWLENPKGNPKEHWKKHIIWHSACNETPTYVDLLGTGKRVLIMGFQPKGKGNEGQMAYFTPNAKSPNALWDMHPISVPSAPGKEVPGTQKFNHGLGVGDVNGDGRKDVICTGGWWEQ